MLYNNTPNLRSQVLRAEKSDRTWRGWGDFSGQINESYRVCPETSECVRKLVNTTEDLPAMAFDKEVIDMP